MKWIFITTAVMVYSSPMFCNAECRYNPNNQKLRCKNTTYEEYKNFILNEVTEPIIGIDFTHTTITSLNITFFDFEQIKNVEGFSTFECSIEKVEAFTFSKLKKLDSLLFSFNNVPLEISPNALKGLNSLLYFEASTSKITHIESGTFADLPKLQVIDLRNNNITILKAGIFSGATNVEGVSLLNSQISNIEPNAFNDLNNLKTLGLGFNKLKTLPLGLFKNLKKLISLYLLNNLLDSFSFKALEGLSSLESLDIFGNNIEVLDVTDFHKNTPNLKQIYINRF